MQIHHAHTHEWCLMFPGLTYVLLQRYNTILYVVLRFQRSTRVFGSDPHGISSIAMQVNLEHLMSTRHSTPLPATYARGRKCLYYALDTQAVAQADINVGFEAFNERMQSDHWAYFIDLDTTLRFGSATQCLSKRVPRMLKTNNLAQMTEYLRTKYRILEDHNVFARAEQLTLPGVKHQFAERLDKDILEASLAAEKALKHYG